MQTNDFDVVGLQWGRIGESCDEFQLQWSTDGQEWRDVTAQRIDCKIFGGTLTFSPNSELLTYDFRVRAVQGGRSSNWVFAQLVRGIRPPTMSGAQSADGINELVWVNRSVAANSLLLERSPLANGVPSGHWAVLPANFGATSYRDVDLQEDVAYRYRVTYGRDGTRSAPAEWSFPAVHLLAPIDFHATLGTDGTRFTWTNRSSQATALSLNEVPLPLSATAFLEAPFPWPGETYRLFVSATGPSASSSAAITFESFRLPGIDTSLDAAVLDHLSSFLPQPGDVARHPDGTWEIIGDHACLETRKDPAQPSEFHCAAGATGFLAPGVRVDSAGNPHLLFQTSEAARSGHTNHNWRDAAGWHSEEAVFELGFAGTFDVDAAGSLHPLEARGNPSGPRYGELAAGTWTWTSVPLPTSSFAVSKTMLAFASDGSPQVAMQDGAGNIAVSVRAADGSFSTESVVQAEKVQLVPGASAQPGIACISQGKAFYVQRQAGTWLAPEPIADTIASSRLWAGHRPDQDAVDVLLEVPDATHASHLELWRRAAAGWHGMAIAHAPRGFSGVSPSPMTLAGGYLSAGRLWLSAQPFLATAGGTWVEP